MCGSEAAMIFVVKNPDSARLTRRAPQPAVLARLRGALADFAAHFRQVRPALRSENRRIFSAMLTLGLCACIVAAGAFYDAPGVQWAQQQSAQTVAFFAKVTKLGDSGYVFALSAIVCIGAWLLRNGASARRDAALGALSGRAFYLFTVAAVSGVLSQILKHLFGRARPKLFDVVGAMHFDAFSITATYASFPSGHAVTAFAMATAIGFVSPKWRWPLMFAAAMIAASRVIIGAHYVSDVLAGAALGFGSAMLVRRIFASRHIVFRREGTSVGLRGAGIVSKLLLKRAAP